MSVRLPVCLFLTPMALAALMLGSTANAAITVYTTQASYLAAITSPGVDTFDDLSTSSQLGGPLSRTAGAYSYTANVGPLSNFFPANNASDPWLAPNDRRDTITFSAFSSGVRGVGGFFFGSDAAGLYTTTPAVLTLTATDSLGATSVQTLANPVFTSFIGFVSTGAMSTVSVYVGVAGVGTVTVWPTINNLTLGTVTPVPEVSTYAMMLGGLALLGAAARRNKKS